MKQRIATGILAFALVVMCMPALGQELGQEPGQDLAQDDDGGFRLERISGDPPRYPRKAFSDGIEGWVDIEITVDPDGRVEDLAIVDAEPRRVFERAALRAVARWRFRPPGDEGITTPQTGKVRVNFRLGE